MGRDSSEVKDVVGTSQARRSLPGLARDAAKRSRPGKTLLENAVEIHPRGEERSAYLVPEVDIEAHEARIRELEDEIEDIAVEFLLARRGQEPAAAGLPLAEVIAGFGFTQDELRRAP